MPTFFVGPGDPNSGSHACMASNLLTDPPSQSLYFLLKKWLNSLREEK